MREKTELALARKYLFRPPFSHVSACMDIYPVTYVPRRLQRAVGFLLLALPLSAQLYNSNNVTPPTSLTGKLNSAASGKQVGIDGNNHAILELGDATNSVDLHPGAGLYATSMAISTDDVEQCGYATISGAPHAMKWSGSAASYVDIHGATGQTWSYCLGSYGGQQVGFGERPVYTTTFQYAYLWSGISAINIHPIQLPFQYSKALGVRGGQQVGYASTVPYPYGDTFAYQSGHAILWTGTAASAVDLHPVGYVGSQALATNGTQQGGWVTNTLPPTSQHAALWSGTPGTFVDLHPIGYNDSRITALTATQQVGDGWVGPMGAPGSVRHALVWSGTPDSVVDLNQFLPLGYLHAVATGVDALGNVVGYAYNTPAQGLVVPSDAIAVVFAPGPVAASAVASVLLSQTNVAPGAVVLATVTLGGPAPIGGITLNLITSNAALLAPPATVFIPAGQTGSTFSLTAGGSALQTITPVKLYATSGVSSRQASLIITPVVNLSSITVNPVEGGFTTTGTVNLSIPAQAGGALVILSSASPLVVVPATVPVQPGYTYVSFTVTTSSVMAATPVAVTATYNGVTVSGLATLSPAPVVAVGTLILPSTQIGGQPVTGTVTVTNFPRNAGGVVITITSGDTRTVSSSSVTIPQGAYSAAFSLPTTVVTGTKGVSIKAILGSSSATANVSILPIPTITIVQADYFTDTHIFKVAATTTNINATFTFGTDPLLGAIGTMQYELGQFKGATTALLTAPALATVWSSDGGQATMAVTQKLSTSTGGGGGGGGGGTTSGFKLTISRTGKGTVTSNPSGVSCGTGSGCAVTFPANTSIQLTAVPDPGATFTGWGGTCSGTATTCTVVLSANQTVTAAFR